MAKAKARAKKPAFRPEAAGETKQVFSKAARDEKDPAWRDWFMDVERRRKALADPAGRPLVFSECDKEGGAGKIVRRKSEPVRIDSLIKREKKRSGAGLDIDMLLLQSAWREAAGDEIAELSGVESFVNGVLQVQIFSSSLLQEIRQFLAVGILSGLRGRWPIDVPLVRIEYKLGKRNSGT